jgi:hypothetical protein
MENFGLDNAEYQNANHRTDGGVGTWFERRGALYALQC